MNTDSAGGNQSKSFNREIHEPHETKAPKGRNVIARGQDALADAARVNITLNIAPSPIGWERGRGEGCRRPNKRMRVIHWVVERE
jgi:hypothetical protein